MSAYLALGHPSPANDGCQLYTIMGLKAARYRD